MAISGNNYYFDNNAGNCNSNFLVENACGSSNAFSITCPDSIYTVIPVGSDSVAINWDDPVVNTTCTTGNITLTSSMPNGSLLGVGEYTITYQATDGCNQSGSCSFVVNVGDSPAVLNMSVLNCPDAYPNSGDDYIIKLQINNTGGLYRTKVGYIEANQVFFDFSILTPKYLPAYSSALAMSGRYPCRMGAYG